MNGSEALIELLLGKKIRRKIWNPETFWYLKNNKLHNEKNIQFNMTFNELIMGDDWELYSPYFTSIEAIEHMKSGKKIGHIYWAKNKYLKMAGTSIVNQDNKETQISFSNLEEKQWFCLEDFDVL